MQKDAIRYHHYEKKKTNKKTRTAVHIRLRNTLKIAQQDLHNSMHRINRFLGSL